jgi:hypothetical protein
MNDNMNKSFKDKKLIENIRTVVIQNKFDEDLAIEERLLNIDLDTLRKYVTPHEDDPLLYDEYELNLEQIELLNPYMDNPITMPVFTDNYYILCCEGVYEDY